MKKLIAFGLGFAFVAGTALASNTGFKLNYPLAFNTSPGASQLNLVSPPYFYFPNGNVGQTPQTARSFCLDLNNFVATNPLPKVSQIVRFNSTTDTVTTQGCAAPVSSFDLVPGAAYGVKPVTTGITIDIVGSHDDTFAPNKTSPPTLFPLFWGPSPASNNNWFSVPYHVKVNNARELCLELNALTTNKIGSIVRINAALDTATTQACIAPVSAFDLVPGAGYSVKPSTSGAAIGVEVY